MQDSRAFVRASPGDGFPEPWAHAGRHHGDPRLARYCVRGNRPVINLSGPIRDESLTPDRVTTWRRATRPVCGIGGSGRLLLRACDGRRSSVKVFVTPCSTASKCEAVHTSLLFHP